MNTKKIIILFNLFFLEYVDFSIIFLWKSVNHYITIDNTKKPEKKNPKKGTFCLSKLIFGWMVPYLFKGSRRGLNKDDLTKCLKEDKSEDLGDKLGR